MDKKSLEDIMKSKLNGDYSKVIEILPAIASSRLAECAKSGISGLGSIDSLCHGSNEDLMCSFLEDAVGYALYERGVVDSFAYTQDTTSLAINLLNLSRKDKIKSAKVSLSDADKYYGVFAITEDAFDGTIGNKKEEIENTDVTEESVEENTEDVEEQEKKSKKDSDTSEKIRNLVMSQTTGVLSELLKRYSGLFASGYEVEKPAGLLTSIGLVSLSGSEMKVKYNKADTMFMYSLFKDAFGFKEDQSRSEVDIAQAMLNEYRGSRTVIYFPYKMLEYAYGRKAPDGDRQSSLHTYKEHADSNSWDSFSRNELTKSIRRLLDAVVLWYNDNECEGRLAETLSSHLVDLVDFLGYVGECLSMCLLMCTYDVVKNKELGTFDVSVFKLRTCDPKNKLGTRNYANDIIAYGFAGGRGVDPLTLEPRFEEEEGTFVKEYGHEFNHKVSQAMPLFAYKAFDALQRKGVKPEWDNMVLGKFEDGTVLKNGSHGVSLNKNLVHFITAGSRAGKGVMTLNIMASGIYSNKSVFYLDDKPDMASMFAGMSNQMFAVNGNDYKESYDSYHQFVKQQNYSAGERTPKELLNIIGKSNTWMNLGGLYYLRAFRLCMGIIMARGMCYPDGDKENVAIPENLGGKDGILLVVDEISNIQANLQELLGMFEEKIPPRENQIKLARKSKDGIPDGIADNDNYYALCFMKNLIEDVNTLGNYARAGFATREISQSDVIVIGQNVDYAKQDTSVFKSFDSMRYNMNRCGLGNEAAPFKAKNGSFIQTMLSFKTTDAFFGYNSDFPKFFASTNRNSKAYGKLDKVTRSFGYVSSWSESDRQALVQTGNDKRELELAGNLTYFRPYLILNNNTPQYTETLLNFSEEAGISKDTVIQSNEDPNNPGSLNPRVGFENYLRGMGISDYQERLRKGIDIINHVIHDLLGYPGNWLEFITDMRPQWMFSIRDIVEGVKGNVSEMPLKNIPMNPILREYYEYDPTFGGCYNGGDAEGSSESVSEYFENGFEEEQEEESDDFIDDEPVEDFVEEYDDIEKSLDKQLSSILGDEDDDIAQLNEADIYETGYGENRTPTDQLHKSQDMQLYDILDTLRTKYGINIETDGSGWVVGQSVPLEEPRVNRQAPPDSLGEEIEDIDFTLPSSALEEIINTITKAAIKKYGGYKNIISIRVEGGGLWINNYQYTCPVAKKYAKIMPYDLAREINSGNIARLFNYETLYQMKNLAKLSFDSVSFTYEYVSTMMGFGSSISVDKFFKYLTHLQVLNIGDKQFTRGDYSEKMKEAGDMFYHYGRAARFGDMCDSILEGRKIACKSYTHDAWHNKNDGLLMRLGKSTIGVVGTVAFGATKEGIGMAKSVKNGIGAFARGFRGLLEDD